LAHRTWGDTGWVGSKEYWEGDRFRRGDKLAPVVPATPPGAGGKAPVRGVATRRGPGAAFSPFSRHARTGHRPRRGPPASEQKPTLVKPRGVCLQSRIPAWRVEGANGRAHVPQ